MNESNNILNECIEQLDNMSKEEFDARRIEVLEKEIQQLKFQNNCLKENLAGVSKCCEATEEENEQLGDTIKRLEGHNTALLEEIDRVKADKEHIEKIYKNLFNRYDELERKNLNLTNVIETLGSLL